MNARIQQALDGEIDRFRLSAEERDDLRQAESEFDAVVNAIPVNSLPDLAPAVLARIRQGNVPQNARASDVPPYAAKPAWPQRILTWIWRPRSISFGWRPVYGLGAVAVAAVVAAIGLRPDAGSNDKAPQVFTRFVVHVPDANSVSLAGDFTGWKPSYVMTRSGAEVWTVVVPLEPGVHTYAFVVDGERWIADPMAPAVDDGFGGLNSRVAVLTPDARKL